VLGSRARFHLGYRWATRAYEGLLAYRAGSLRQMAGAVACALGDVVTGEALRRSRRFGLWPRLMTDAIDAAGWSLAVPGAYDPVVLGGVPLAMEAGMRMGFPGLVVPVLNAALTAAVRARTGRRLGLSAFGWQVLGVAGGVALAGYEKRRWRAESARQSQAMQASAHDAFLLGQNEVAMGADSIVDLLSRTGPLLEERTAHNSVAGALGRWKAALAVTTSRHASYLGTAIAEWERRTNRQPDLSVDVQLHLVEGQGTAVLSGAQAKLLEAELDVLSLRGDHHLLVEESSRPGQDCRLRLGEHLIVLPAEPATRALAFDAGPALLVVSAAWYLSVLSPSLEGAPGWAGLPPGLACIVLAAWSHRAIGRRGDAVRPWLVAGTLAISGLQALLVTPTMANPLTDQGLARFPTAGILPPVLILVRLYYQDLTPPQRWGILVGLGCLLAASWALFPVPVSVLDAVAANLWLVGTIPAIGSVEQALRAQSVALTKQVADKEKTICEAAYAEGRSAVLGLVAQVRFGLWQRFHLCGEDMDPAIRAEAERRLVEVDRRLEDLQWPVGL
jgi:hypothetical protein